MTAVIAAAGSGERLGAGGPKAFVPLGGRPMIAWSLDACLACESVAAVVVAVPAGLRARATTLRRCRSRGRSTAAPTPRRESRRRNALAAVETELVAIHDAARPLLTPELLEALVADARANPDAAGVIAAAPVTDTVKKAAKRPESAARNRDCEHAGPSTLGPQRGSGAAQTPQVFRTAALRAALDVEPEQRDTATDEAMLIEAAGGTVLLHDPGAPNLKVTTPRDLRLAELLLRDRLSP